MNKNCTLPTQKDNKTTCCLYCKKKYRILIEQFLNHDIGYKELKNAVLIINGPQEVKD